MVLDHPLMRDRYRPAQGLGKDYSRFRVDSKVLEDGNRGYVDPFGDVAPAYQRLWIAASAPVRIQSGSGGESGESGRVYDTGLIVLVQEDAAYATLPVRELGKRLAGKGVGALLGFLTVVGLLWYFVLHVQGRTRWWRLPPFVPGSSLASPTHGQVRSTAATKTPRGRT
jgi:hypothetical protein